MEKLTRTPVSFSICVQRVGVRVPLTVEWRYCHLLPLLCQRLLNCTPAFKGRLPAFRALGHSQIDTCSSRPYSERAGDELCPAKESFLLDML